MCEPAQKNTTLKGMASCRSWTFPAHMPEYFALVDAMPGQEAAVGDALRTLEGIQAMTPCREANADFLIRFEAEKFDLVDDFLQTHVRRLAGVNGIEIIERWDEYGSTVHAARDRLTS